MPTPISSGLELDTLRALDPQLSGAIRNDGQAANCTILLDSMRVALCLTPDPTASQSWVTKGVHLESGLHGRPIQDTEIALVCCHGIGNPKCHVQNQTAAPNLEASSNTLPGKSVLLRKGRR